MPLRFEKIITRKKRFLDLLLLADEQESMIDRYLERGEMFVARDDGQVVAECGVTDEAGLDKFIDAQIEAELRRESDYLFTLEVRNYLVKKAGLKMPEAFLKRWLYTINEGKFSMEDIEKDFDQFLKMFTWNYLQKHFIKTDGISVSKEEALSEAKALAASQFAQYGMPSAPDDMLEGYAEKILADKDQGQKIYEKLYEAKVVEDVKSKIKVTEKAVSADDFAKLAKEL